jgi:hypothetical protein
LCRANTLAYFVTLPWANEEFLKDFDHDVFQQLRFGVPLPTNGQLLFALVAEKLGQRSEKHLSVITILYHKLR